jgi:ankyrin repeat protein
MCLLWLAIGLGVLAYAAAGSAKLAGATQMAEGFSHFGLPLWFMKFIGACEVAGAVALLIRPLATWAALGLSVIMIGAIALHGYFDGITAGVPAAALFMLMAFVAWERRGAAPFLSAFRKPMRKAMGSTMLAAVFTVFVLAHPSFATAEQSRVADAAERAEWADVRALLRGGSDANEAQGDGTTALLWAAYHGRPDATRWLLDAGAKPGATNRYGLSPLAQAASEGDAEIIAMLLAAGANPNSTMPEGDTALMLAARSGSEPGVRALLSAGARVDERDEWHGETALMWAAGENHPDVVRLLVEHSAELEAVSTVFKWNVPRPAAVTAPLPVGGFTALHHAARENAYDAVRALLELGADPNHLDGLGYSPLRVAVTNNNLDVAKLLVEHGADVNEGALVEVAKLRALPWIRAANSRADSVTAIDLADLLVAKGADVHKVPPVGMVQQFWLDGPHANEPPLFIAAMGADVEFLKWLAAHGAEVTKSASRRGATVLMAALGFTPPGPPGVPVPNRPIAEAAAIGSAVLDLGADINATNMDGMTALHVAAEKAADDIVTFLIQHGARLDLTDRSNRLAIDVAKGVARVPQPTDPPGFPAFPGIRHESTVQLLRDAMKSAGMAEVPYEDPRPPK